MVYRIIKHFHYPLVPSVFNKSQKVVSLQIKCQHCGGQGREHGWDFFWLSSFLLAVIIPSLWFTNSKQPVTLIQECNMYRDILTIWVYLHQENKFMKTRSCSVPCTLPCNSELSKLQTTRYLVYQFTARYSIKHLNFIANLDLLIITDTY